MIVDWIYNHPTWLWGTILVCGATLLACLGLALFHPFVDVKVRRAHNDLAGFSIAIINVVYAVLLASSRSPPGNRSRRRKRSCRKRPAISAICIATRKASPTRSANRSA
jgi:hypothetical protein